MAWLMAAACLVSVQDEVQGLLDTLRDGDIAARDEAAARLVEKLAASADLVRELDGRLSREKDPEFRSRLEGVLGRAEARLARVRLRLEAEFEPVEGVPWNIAVSPDGRRAAVSGSDHRLFVFDLAAGKLVATLPCSVDARAAWSPDGTLLAASRGLGFVDIHETAGWNRRREVLVAEGASVNWLAFRPDGARLAASVQALSRALVFEIDPANGRTATLLDSAYQEGAAPEALGWASDGAFMVGIRRGSRAVGFEALDVRGRRVRSWEVDAGDEGWFDLRASPDGGSVAVSGPGGCSILDGATGRVLACVKGAHPRVRLAAGGTVFASDGKVVRRFPAPGAGADRTFEAAGGVQAFDVAGGTVAALTTTRMLCVRGMDGAPGVDVPVRHADTLYSVADHPDGKRLAILHRGGVSLWSMSEKRSVGEVALPADAGIFSLAFSSDGSLLLGQGLRRLAVWRTEGLREIGSWAIEAVNLHCFAAPGSDGPVAWTERSGRTCRVCVAAPDGARVVRVVRPADAASLAFSPDGRTLVVGESGRVVLLDARTLEVLRELEVAGEKGQVRAAFTGDGRRLAVEGGAGLRLLDAESGREVAGAVGPGANLGRLDIAAGRIVTATDEGRLAIFAYVARRAALVPAHESTLSPRGTVWASRDGRRIFVRPFEEPWKIRAFAIE